MMEDVVKSIIEKQKILVVEPSSAFLQTILACLKDLGAKTDQIYTSRSYKEAYNLIHEHKPQILVTEYFLGDKFGLSLIEQVLKYHDDSEKLAIVTTHNSASSAVAEAAEEAVDAYLLKPFSTGILRERVMQAIYRKAKPSEYSVKIRNGKKLLKECRYKDALEMFAEATRLDSKPALAHYYSGHANFLQNDYQKALGEFKIGLSLQPLHYMCLLGEFDGEFEQKNYQKAYSLVPTIRAHFPISPNRLGNIFIAAVYSGNMQDVASYFELYQQLDYRPPQLTKIFLAALMVAGKFHIKQKQADAAANCFEMGVTVAGPDVNYLECVVRELLKVNAGARAAVFLTKFPGPEIGKKIHGNLSFLVEVQTQTQTVNDLINKGRKLVTDGLADIDSYLTLLRLLKKADKPLIAEDIASKASVEYPEFRKEIYETLR